VTSPTPPWPVRWPVMYQTWSWLAFLHWSYAPAVVQRLLPDSLQVHTLEGRAWVGVTPFFLEDLRTPVASALPWFTSFPDERDPDHLGAEHGRVAVPADGAPRRVPGDEDLGELAPVEVGQCRGPLLQPSQVVRQWVGRHQLPGFVSGLACQAATPGGSAARANHGAT
jgi:hypothetical protein